MQRKRLTRGHTRKPVFMKCKFFCTVLVLGGIFLLASCKKVALKTVDKNQVALFNCSDSTAQMPYICFDSLLQDSRCPKGRECFWMGTALIKVTFHDNGEAIPFVMALQGYPNLGHVSDTTINGYKIAFTGLEPYPDVNTLPQPGDKTASLSITQ